MQGRLLFFMGGFFFNPEAVFGENLLTNMERDGRKRHLALNPFDGSFLVCPLSDLFNFLLTSLLLHRHHYHECRPS